MPDTTHPLKLLTDFGSAEAFELVYQENYAVLYYLAKRYVLTKEDAEDITADVFTRFWNKKEGFFDLPSVEAFLRKSIRNACLNYLRDTTTHSRKKIELATELSSEEAHTFPEELYETALYRQLYYEIEKLPSKSRQVFKLAYIEGMKNEEIAALLDISYQTVKNQKVQALKMLKLNLVQKGLLMPYLLLELLK